MQATTIRLDDETIRELDALADRQGASRSKVLREAVARYLDHHAWFVAQVQEGLEAIERGDTISHAEAKDRIRSLGFNIDD